MENDKADQNKRMEQWIDENERQVLTSLLEINCQELRSFLKQQGTLSLPGAVKEHKKLELHPFSPMPFMRDPIHCHPIFRHSAKKQSKHRRNIPLKRSRVQNQAILKEQNTLTDFFQSQLVFALNRVEAFFKE